MADQKMFNTVLDLITAEIQAVVNANKDFYKGYDIFVSSELIYAKKKEYHPKTIYINVKFLEASLYYGQTNLPVTLNILSEQNSFDVCRTLIMDFVTQFNLQRDSSGDILQRYDTPVVLSNFNEVGTGFRSLFACRGGFLISTDNNPITSIEYVWYSEEEVEGETVRVEHKETIKPLVSSWHVANQLDSQPFYETKNLTTSEAQVVTFAISFNTYQLMDSHMLNTVLGMINGDEEVEGDLDYNYNNTVYHLNITFKSGKSIEKDMRLSQMSASQPIDGLPTDEYSFTC